MTLVPRAYKNGRLSAFLGLHIFSNLVEADCSKMPIEGLGESVLAEAG